MNIMLDIGKSIINQNTCLKWLIKTNNKKQDAYTKMPQ